MKRLYRAWALAAFALAGAGCGGPGGGGAEATGSVQLDGQPLANAQVQFVAKDAAGVIHATTTDAAGRFTLREDARSNNPLKPGAYAVTVAKTVVKSDPGQPGGMGPTVNEAPPLYGSVAKTPLHADLKEGKNDLPPFELKSQEKP